jgi:hypothetical protein
MASTTRALRPWTRTFSVRREGRSEGRVLGGADELDISTSDL